MPSPFFVLLLPCDNLSGGTRYGDGGTWYPILRATNQTTMEDRIKLVVRWAEQDAAFMKVSCDERVISRVVDAVHQLTDAEVAEYLQD